MFYYIYKMIHVPTGRVYIGRHRLQKGKTPETDDYYGSGALWKQIYKQNPEECVKVVLECVEGKDAADALEKKFIAHYRSIMGEKCVNIHDGGGGVDKHSETSKQKMSEAKRGEKHPNFGKMGEETSMFGKHHSEASRKKMSEAHKGEKNHFFGKKHSEATREKMSLSLKGKTPWNKGKTGVYSESSRKKMSESAKNRTKLK